MHLTSSALALCDTYGLLKFQEMKWGWELSVNFNESPGITEYPLVYFLMKLGIQSTGNVMPVEFHRAVPETKCCSSLCPQEGCKGPSLTRTLGYSWRWQVQMRYANCL